MQGMGKSRSGSRIDSDQLRRQSDRLGSSPGLVEIFPFTHSKVIYLLFPYKLDLLCLENLFLSTDIQRIPNKLYVTLYHKFWRYVFHSLQVHLCNIHKKGSRTQKSGKRRKSKLIHEIYQQLSLIIKCIFFQVLETTQFMFFHQFSSPLKFNHKKMFKLYGWGTISNFVAAMVDAGALNLADSASISMQTVQ